MFKFEINVLILILLISIFASCTFERRNPLDPLSTVSQSAPYDVMISGASEFMNYGETAALSVSATDLEGDAITFTWSCVGGTFSNTQGASTVFTSGSVFGDYNIICRAKDEVGLYTDVAEFVHIGMTAYGILTVDEIWKGTHNLTGDIIVPQGRTLTIADSALLKISASDGSNLGSSTAKIEMIIYGALHIQGSETSPVSIEGVSATSDCWMGIYINGTFSVSDLVLANAVCGINSASLPAGKYEFSQCETAVQLGSASSNISDSSFIECGTGIYASGSSLLIRDTLFDNCVKGIVNINGTADLGTSLDHGNNSFICSEYSFVNISAANIDALGNWWNSLNSTVIDSAIYDDDEGGNGWVDYSDFLSSQP
ncbi:hypothetical protein KAR04_07580 [Candidatus Calescamantes bacterium]|nr:hypothetical protein [Candidatus Calescamantes bacterium]MCK5599719.1 hypothetical protein [bacterium]